MAEVTIRFRHNPNTGKREFIIGYESDSDALPHEHEKDHRAMVEQILGMPLGDDDEVTVERISKGEAQLSPEEEAEAVRQREALREGD
jgi:hypothetical protein